MAQRSHNYPAHLVWTGQAHQTAPQSRSYQLQVPGKPPIDGSSDPVFRGDAERWNPEDLLVASLSACHHLWYMSLCARAGIKILSYEDAAEGKMIEEPPGGAGQFTEVILRPRIVIAAGSDRAKAESLHHTAHENCFIARSVNFPVRHQPVIEVEGT